MGSQLTGTAQSFLETIKPACVPHLGMGMCVELQEDTHPGPCSIHWDSTHGTRPATPSNLLTLTLTRTHTHTPFRSQVHICPEASPIILTLMSKTSSNFHIKSTKTSETEIVSSMSFRLVSNLRIPSSSCPGPFWFKLKVTTT